MSRGEANGETVSYGKETNGACLCACVCVVFNCLRYFQVNRAKN